MSRNSLLSLTLVALVVGASSAQEPKPRNPPAGGVPRGEFEPGAGGPGQRVRPGGPPGKGSLTNNPPFAGRGPMGGGLPEGRGRPGEMRGPGFVPLGPRMGDNDRLRQDDPEMFNLVTQDQQLEQQTADLADQVRRAASEQREKLREQLTELINKHFDIRQQRRELQLKRMEAELGRLREAIKQRNEAREAIIKERLTELAGDAKGLGF